MASMGPLALESLERAFEYHQSLVYCLSNQQWFDLNGKSFMSFQYFDTGSDGYGNNVAYFTFANATDDDGMGIGEILLAPTSVVGPDASWITSGTHRLQIAPGSGGVERNVYATWENIPFRYVKFGLSDLGVVAENAWCFAHIYAR